jgi:hypothetical protein
MALIHICRLAAHNGQPKFVPGSVSCAASGRRASFRPTQFPLSSTLKRVSGALALPLNRLRPIAA